MRVPLLDLKAQYSKLKPAIDEAALRVLASGRHVMGPELEAYEKELAAYLDLPHAVTVASGTDALLSAAMALGIQPGDDVVTPAYSFFATPETAVRLGARPVFCDIEEDGFNADVNDFLNKIPPKEKKILQLFRLRQLHNAVFLKNSKAAMNMLRRVEPWVTFGCPTRATIKKLVYKRGYGKINGQRIPLTCNELVEKELGKFNIRCIEDLIHELWSCGPHFKEANAFLWPFKLDSPRGGLRTKRHQFIIGGDFGPREEFINELANNML